MSVPRPGSAGAASSSRRCSCWSWRPSPCRCSRSSGPRCSGSTPSSFRSVFLTELGAKVLLGVLGGLLTAGVVGSSLVIAYRTRPIYAPTTTNRDALERYRAAVEPLRRLAMVGIPVVIGLLSGLGAAGQWKTYLLWRNAVPFGKDRSAVRHGRRVLRLHPAVARVRRRLPQHGPHHRCHHRRVHALHLRCPAVPGAQPPHDLRGPPAPVRAAGRDRRRPRGQLPAGPLLADHQDRPHHRHPVHRRHRRAAHQDHPRGGLVSVRPGLLLDRRSPPPNSSLHN